MTRCGRICLGSRKINLSTVFAGQNVGIKQVADQETERITSAGNPFGARVFPMCPE